MNSTEYVVTKIEKYDEELSITKKADIIHAITFGAFVVGYITSEILGYPEMKETLIFLEGAILMNCANQLITGNRIKNEKKEFLQDIMSKNDIEGDIKESEYRRKR